MATDFLAFKTAEQHVHSYADTSSDLMAKHAEAMDCRDCEAFLQIGIDAFDWLMRADRVIRMAIYRGDRDFDPKIEDALRLLCKLWLKPCEFAKQWIALQQQKGYDIDNLAEFRRCMEEMQAIVGSNAGESDGAIPEHIASLRDSAISEHLNGQTAEFI